VRVLCDGKEVALGTVVGPDGWILTKASELKGKIVCRFSDQRQLEAETVGVDPRFDLAMLKVDAQDLPHIQWAKTKPDVGQWVAAPGVDGQPLALGVVSVPRRAIPLIPGILGVVFSKTVEAAKIVRILAKSPAAKAGLKVDDRIVAINGKSTPSRQAVIAMVKKFRPGTAVTMKIERGDNQLEVKATLGKLVTPGTRRRDMQNAMGVGVSKRRDAFPVVVQHDSVLRPTDCGGPLVDLSGKVIGVNIARGGRTETYSVPSDVLVMLMYDLMSGRLRPPAETASKKEPVPSRDKQPAQPAASDKDKPKPADKDSAAKQKPGGGDHKQQSEGAEKKPAAGDKKQQAEGAEKNPAAGDNKQQAEGAEKKPAAGDNKLSQPEGQKPTPPQPAEPGDRPAPGDKQTKPQGA
jgi:serine protease Do